MAVVAFLLAGCSSGDSPRIVVSAASSLTDAFTEMASAFEGAEGVTVDLNFGSSSELAVQINEGAPADVFASANQAQMQVVLDAGSADTSEVLAQNGIVVVTPADSTVVEDFEGIASDGVRLVLAGPDVPVGAYAREAIEAANASYGVDFSERVRANVVSEEANVRAVLTKVELGEADAGIVYRTDAAISGDAVQTHPIPADLAPPARYYIAALADSSDAAIDFLAFVRSEEGRAILQKYGFGTAID